MPTRAISPSETLEKFNEVMFLAPPLLFRRQGRFIEWLRTASRPLMLSLDHNSKATESSQATETQIAVMVEALVGDARRTGEAAGA